MERLQKIEQPRSSVLKTALVATFMAISTIMVFVRTRAQDVLDNAPQTQPQSQPQTQAASERIATWNISWLSDKDESGIVKRKEEDFKNIASVIRQTRAALWCLQEIKNDEALERLKKYLEDSIRTKVLGKGAQRLGLMWDSKKVEVNNIRLLTELEDANFDFARVPMAADFRMGDFDGTVVVMHVKFPNNRESRERQAEEIRRVRTWAEEYSRRADTDPDVIVGGDWNMTLTETQVPKPLILFVPKFPTLVSGNGTPDSFFGTEDTNEEMKPGAQVLKEFKEISWGKTTSDHWCVIIEANTATGTADKKKN